jgi:hypothetical protein
MHDVVDPNSGPPPLPPSDTGRAIPQSRQTITVADKHIFAVHQTFRLRDHGADEAIEHLVQALVPAGNSAMPGTTHVMSAGEQPPWGAALPTGVERVLRLVQIIKPGYRGLSLFLWLCELVESALTAVRGVRPALCHNPAR